MQKKHIWQLLLSSRLIRINNFIILGIGCLILVTQLYWFWGPTQMAKVTNYENTNWKLIKGNKTKEECLNLLPGQKLEYSFKSSAEVSFNIYYHEQGGGPIYLMDEKGTVFNKGVLEPTKKDRYCLSWKNHGIGDVHLSYNTQLLPLFEDQIKTHWKDILACGSGLALAGHNYTNSLYLRFEVNDKPGVLSQITKSLASSNISVERLIQIPDHKNKKASIIIITHETNELNANKCLKSLNTNKNILKIPTRIRLF